jgi:hypothetical protein
LGTTDITSVKEIYECMDSASRELEELAKANQSDHFFMGEKMVDAQDNNLVADFLETTFLKRKDYSYYFWIAKDGFWHAKPTEEQERKDQLVINQRAEAARQAKEAGEAVLDALRQ